MCPRFGRLLYTVSEQIYQYIDLHSSLHIIGRSPFVLAKAQAIARGSSAMHLLFMTASVMVKVSARRKSTAISDHFYNASSLFTMQFADDRGCLK